MISKEAFIAYRKELSGRIYYAEPGDFLVVEGPDGETYRVTETSDEDFLDLIKRSKEEGHNLFFTKDRLFDPYPDKAVIY